MMSCVSWHYVFAYTLYAQHLEHLWSKILKMPSNVMHHHFAHVACFFIISQELGVLDLLFSLFRSPYMATSLRLLIVKTMDELTQTQAGITWFMGETSEGTDQATSGYQQLIDITLSKQVLTNIQLHYLNSLITSSVEFIWALIFLLSCFRYSCKQITSPVEKLRIEI